MKSNSTSLKSKYEVRTLEEFQIGFLQIIGIYKYGGLGNQDAEFIQQEVNSMLNDKNINGLVVDFTQMSYEWGNAIFNTLNTLYSSKVPCSVIYSEKCAALFGGDDPLAFKSDEAAIAKIIANITAQ